MLTSTGANVGCILSKGTWSQQTCATFRPTAGSVAGTIKFTSSKGLCAVEATNGTLSCASDITVASDFTNVGLCFFRLLQGLIGVLMMIFILTSTFQSTSTTGSLLVFNGSSSFSADVLPTGSVQSPVFVGGDHSEVITLVYTRV